MSIQTLERQNKKVRTSSENRGLELVVNNDCLDIGYFSINNRVKMIYFFLFMVMFQNIIAILFCRDIPLLYNTIFSVIKELMLYVALFFSIIKH